MPGEVLEVPANGCSAATQPQSVDGEGSHAQESSPGRLLSGGRESIPAMGNRSWSRERRAREPRGHAGPGVPFGTEIRSPYLT